MTPTAGGGGRVCSKMLVYVKGLRHGRFWSIKRGYKVVAVYHRGYINGIRRLWHRDGKLRTEIVYFRGLRNGVARGWNALSNGRFERRTIVIPPALPGDI